jgi:hypothetical protein
MGGNLVAEVAVGTPIRVVYAQLRAYPTADRRPDLPKSVTSAACMVMRSTACTVSVSRSGCSSGIRDLSCIATGQIADMVRVC